MTRAEAIEFVGRLALACAVLALGVGFVLLEILHRTDAPPPPILVDAVRADLQLCTPVRPAPRFAPPRALLRIGRIA